MCKRFIWNVTESVRPVAANRAQRIKDMYQCLRHVIKQGFKSMSKSEIIILFFDCVDK